MNTFLLLLLYVVGYVLIYNDYNRSHILYLNSSMFEVTVKNV
jgi:hypothetical protein